MRVVRSVDVDRDRGRVGRVVDAVDVPGWREAVDVTDMVVAAADHVEGVVATELPGSQRHVYAATYGEPPDPPATAALLSALGEAATSATSSPVT